MRSGNRGRLFFRYSKEEKWAVEIINFLSPIEDIDYIFYYMDVSGNLENDQNYVGVVGTSKNLLKLMENKKVVFITRQSNWNLSKNG